MQELLELDRSVFRAINLDLHRTWLDPVFWFVTSTGLGWVQIVLLLPSLLSPRLRHLFWLGIANWAIVGGSASVLKRLVPRERPGNLDTTLLAPDERIFFGSFPSGHTTQTFGLATILFLWAMRNGMGRFGALAYVWAILVGISRIYRGVHWPSDVLGGALLGIGGGALIFIAFEGIAARKGLAYTSPPPTG